MRVPVRSTGKADPSASVTGVCFAGAELAGSPLIVTAGEGGNPITMEIALVITRKRESESWNVTFVLPVLRGVPESVKVVGS